MLLYVAGMLGETTGVIDQVPAAQSCSSPRRIGIEASCQVAASREREARRCVERPDIVQHVLSGETCAKIAIEMGRSESTIREWYLREMERTATEAGRRLTLTLCSTGRCRRKTCRLHY
jgi:hypothetical protein